MHGNSEIEYVEAQLRSSGIDITDLYDLWKDKALLARATPLLVEYLRHVSSFEAKREIIRVLPGNAIHPESLVAELRDTRKALQQDDKNARSLAWTIAEALARSDVTSVFDDLVRLIHDKDLGKARQMLTYAIARVRGRRDDAIATLRAVLVDQDLTPQALDALGKLKATEAAEDIAEYLQDKRPLVRRESQKALNKIQVQ